MDLFSLTCTTCKTRLKVREQSAIGQILACPKCGGMVMVKPPPSWSAGTAEHAEQATATEVIANVPQVNQTIHNSAFEALDDLLADAPPKMRPLVGPAPSSSPGAQPPAAAGGLAGSSATPTTAPGSPSAGAAAAVKPRFVEGPRVLPTPRLKSNATPPTGLPAIAPAAIPATVSLSPTPVNQPAPAVRDSAPLPPPPPAEHAESDAAPQAAGRVRFWLLTAGSVALGIVLAFLAVTAAIRVLRGPAAGHPIAKSNGESSNNAPSANDPDGGPSPDSLPPESAPQNAVAPPDTAMAPETLAREPGPPVAPAIAASPTPADPVGIVAAPPAPGNSKTPATDSLAKYDRILGNEAPLATQAAPLPAAPAPAPPDDAGPVRPVAPRPPPREIDVAKRLADPILGIETAGTPLADFLQLVSELSTIPITLEPDALPIVNASASSPVAFSAANSTVGGALTAALRPLKLEAIEADGQLVVRAAEPAQLATLNFPVKDLAADEEAMTALAELLQALVEPASWGDSPEQPAIAVDAKKGTLAVRHTRAVHAQLLLLCEKLRTARGQKPVSRIDPTYFKLDTRHAKAQSRLETPVSLNFSQPTRLTTWFDRLGEPAGVRILVDWRDLASAGWNPAGEAALVVNQQPLSAALDALLGPLDLTWRIVDGQTLQIVTPTALAQRTEIELYKVGDLLAGDPAGSDHTGETLLAKIRTTLGDAAFRAGGGNGEIRFDEAGQCLLASLPQPQQRELEALLAKWRAAAKK